MKAQILTALFLICSAPVANSEADGPRTVDFYGGFEGRWEGGVRSLPSQAFDPGSPGDQIVVPQEVALEISKDGVKVYLKQNGSWSEINAGQWRLVVGATNAVLFSITSDVRSNNDASGWVETWNFSITHKDRDSIYVVATRVVNNFSKPSDYVENKDGKIYSAGRVFHTFYGEMTRPNSTAK
jgi:hypothetical protein